jgi:hypothetical protein
MRILRLWLVLFLSAALVRADLTSNQLIGFGVGRRNVVQDNFNRADGSLGSDWTVINGAADISSNVFRCTTASTYDFAIHNTSIGSISYAVKTKVSLGVAQFPMWLFRFTSSGSAFYVLYYSGGSHLFEWQNRSSSGGSNTGISGATSTAVTLADGDSVGITLTGTGTSTRLRIWKNPAANVPRSATEWDSGDSPAITFSFVAGSGAAVDSGTKVGIGGFTSSSNGITQDDFVASGL